MRLPCAARRTVLFPGMSRSRSSSALTLAACLGLFACTPPLMVGAPCALPSDCPEAYTCLLGRCRTECATNRDCSVGGAVGMCLVDEVTGLRACRTVEEESCTMTCGEGLSCIGGRCAQTCEETSECSGTLCRTAGPVRACLEPTATTCTADGECPFSRCEGEVCDPALAVSAGGQMTCVLLESGRLACAGGNTGSFHHLGGATEEPSFVPLVDGSGLRPDFEAVELGLIHGCALTNGRVRCWGGGDFGQNGTGTAAPPVPGALSTLTGVEEISAAFATSCVRTATDVLCFGWDQFGQLGDAAIHDPPDRRTSSTPVRVALPAGFVPVAMATGGYHGCAVGADGSLQCWGGNDYEQLGGAATETCSYEGTDYGCQQTPIRVDGFGPGEVVAVDVALGQSHTCVLDDRGGVHCFGRNAFGQLGGGVVGDHFAGTVTPFTSGVRAIDAGQYHTCALLDDGRLSCWGNNDQGQLGTNGPFSSITPTDVIGLDDVVAFSCGDVHTCAIEGDGAVYCWGQSERGRLGDGNVAASPVPVPVRVRVGG